MSSISHGSVNTVEAAIANVQFWVGIAIVILVLAVVALLLMWYVMMSYKGAKEELDRARTAVAKCRKRRYSMAGNIISTYRAAIGEKAYGDMASMLSRYGSVKRESEEIAWENEWMPKMRSIMSTVSSKIPAASKQSFASLTDEFEHNEEKLGILRDKIQDDKQTIATIEGNRFLSAVLKVSGKLVDGIATGRQKGGEIQQQITSIEQRRQDKQKAYEDLFN